MVLLYFLYRTHRADIIAGAAMLTQAAVDYTRLAVRNTSTRTCHAAFCAAYAFSGDDSVCRCIANLVAGSHIIFLLSS